MHINQNKIPKTWKFRDQFQRPKPQQKGKKIKKKEAMGTKMKKKKNCINTKLK